MRRWAALTLLLSAGCSTAPIADLMDRYYPSSAASSRVTRVVATSGPIVSPGPVVPRLPMGPLPVAEPPEVSPPKAPKPRPEPEPEPAPPPKPLPDGVTPAVFRSKIERPERFPLSLPGEVSLPR